MDSSNQSCSALEAFSRAHRTGLLTIVFTDIVGSTALKQQWGEHGALELVQRHHSLVRELLRQVPDAQEIETAGDSFLLVFARPSDAVRFSLQLLAKLGALAQTSGMPVLDRIGVHVGEVIVQEQGGDSKLFGSPVDVCARVMGLAQENQILMTRFAFDNARRMLRPSSLEGMGALSWLNHGAYLLKGVEEPIEICEVRAGLEGPATPPIRSDKAQRITAEGDLVLGWRPAVDQSVPNTKWILEEKLGEGGFGEVWKAGHEKLKQNRVFKFCFRADRVRSLRREVTLFRLLKERIGEHPNIVKLHDLYFDQPPYFLEEEYLAGKDLKSWCEAQGGVDKIPLEVRLEIVAQAAEGLQAAHDAGVIHRDVKPGNILVDTLNSRVSGPTSTEPGSSAPSLTVKLTDFGIGQVTSEEVLAGLTQAGFTQTLGPQPSSSVTGTQLYLAPELWAGQAASIRSDIYSLGVVLYQVIIADFGRPVTVDWDRSVNDPLLRADLVLCLAGNPQDRFAGAVQLARQLRQLPARRAEMQRQEAEQARLRAAQAERQRWQERAARRRQWLVGAVAMTFVLIALAVALGYGLHRARMERDQLRRVAYASDMKGAQVALQQENRGLAMDLIHRYSPKPGLEDLRGVEWRYLWQESRGDEIKILPHPHIVNTALMTPDGQGVVTYAMDGKVRVWEAASGKVTREFDCGTSISEPTTVAAISPDGTLLAFRDADGMQVRETGGWTVVHRLDSAWEPVVFTPDGRHLICAGAAPETLLVWKVSDWSHRVLTNGSAGFNNLAVSPDSRLVSGHGGQVWDLGTGAKMALSEPERTMATAFSPDGKWFAAGTWSGEVVLWDLEKRQWSQRFKAHPALTTGLAFSPDSRLLATGGNDQLIRLWETGTSNCVATLHGHRYEIWSLQFSKDGQTLVSASEDGSARLWNVRPRTSLTRSLTLGADALPFGVLSDGTALVTFDRAQESIRLLGLPTGQLVRSFDWHELALRGCTNVGVFPAKTLVVGVATNGIVHRWNLATSFHFETRPVGAAGFLPRALSADEHWLLGVFPSGDGILCDLRANRIRQRLSEVRSWPGSAAFSPDGRWLAFANPSSGVVLWNLAKGRVERLLAGHRRPVDAVAFSPDGRLLASAGSDGAGRLWTVPNGLPLGAPLLGHQSGLIAVGFSADGKTVITGSNDHTIRCWSVATGQEMLVLKDADMIRGTGWVVADNKLVWQALEGPIQVAALPTLAEIDAQDSQQKY